jgi:hypothetical protein
MADVFLSYKREDQETAREIAADLEAEGFSVFFDVRIPVGDSWDAVIERELNAAKAVVVLWSPRSRDSQWVRREAREAMSRRILCPAMIANCKIPLEFSDAQAANLIGRRPGDRAHAEWRRLCDGVARCTGKRAMSVTPTPTPQADTSSLSRAAKYVGDTRAIDTNRWRFSWRAIGAWALASVLAGLVGAIIFVADRGFGGDGWYIAEFPGYASGYAAIFAIVAGIIDLAASRAALSVRWPRPLIETLAAAVIVAAFPGLEVRGYLWPAASLAVLAYWLFAGRPGTRPRRQLE